MLEAPHYPSMSTHPAPPFPNPRYIHRHGHGCPRNRILEDIDPIPSTNFSTPMRTNKTHTRWFCWWIQRMYGIFTVDNMNFSLLNWWLNVTNMMSEKFFTAYKVSPEPIVINSVMGPRAKKGRKSMGFTGVSSPFRSFIKADRRFWDIGGFFETCYKIKNHRMKKSQVSHQKMSQEENSFSIFLLVINCCWNT